METPTAHEHVYCVALGEGSNSPARSPAELAVLLVFTRQCCIGAGPFYQLTPSRTGPPVYIGWNRGHPM
jgi:hypothetical protein